MQLALANGVVSSAPIGRQLAPGRPGDRRCGSTPARIAAAFGVLCVLMLGGLPGSAPAATVSADAGVLRVSGGTRERNDETITVVGGSALFRDASAPVAAGPGCWVRTSDTVICGLVKNARLDVDLGDRDDTVRNDTALRAVLYGGSGEDLLIGGAGADQIQGGDGFDNMEGRGGPDSISTRGLFMDRVSCGPGEDLVYADASDLVAGDCERVERSGDTGQQPVPGNPPLAVVPQFTPGACIALRVGTEADDDLRGDVAGDAMLGMGGNDRLQGAPGNDCLYGGTGRDDLLGDENDDFLAGGDASDHLSGGEGDDRLGGEAGTDSLDGGKGADTLAGGARGDRARGGGGDDLINAGRGRDLLAGGVGDDALAGGRGADRLRAGGGANRLSGGGGDDVLLARNGQPDRLRCGAGVDAVWADRVDRVRSDCEHVSR